MHLAIDDEALAEVSEARDYYTRGTPQALQKRPFVTAAKG
jgi:hypothetical protein